MALQRSALHQLTAAAGGTVQERFGWELPAIISTASSEYLAATTGTAVHDISYVGRLHAIGDDALDLLNRLSTNKVDELASGQGAPTILTTDAGRILDLIHVVNTGGHTLIITSPELQQTIIDWLDKYTIMEDLEVEDHTTSDAMLHLVGPTSRQWLEQTGDVDLGGLSAYGMVSAQIAALGGIAVQVIDKPFGPLPGFALLLSNQDAPALWNHLLETGVTPIGTEAYETVRVENAVPAYGNEMGQPYNPLEAGLIGSIDFTKGCYIGQEVIARLDTYQKVQKHLVTLRFSPDATPSWGSGLVQDGKVIGRVTSLGSIPNGGDTIGMGYVRKAVASEGVTLELETPAEGSAEITGFSQLFGPGE